ncbi:MAG: hypothetical protein JNJ50_19735 [Acidobacteria bacterium]|nr:hypothetical protein [Acidobacteriota bacterium]
MWAVNDSQVSGIIVPSLACNLIGVMSNGIPMRNNRHNMIYGSSVICVAIAAVLTGKVPNAASPLHSQKPCVFPNRVNCGSKSSIKSGADRLPQWPRNTILMIGILYITIGSNTVILCTANFRKILTALGPFARVIRVIHSLDDLTLDDLTLNNSNRLSPSFSCRTRALGATTMGFSLFRGNHRLN